MSHLHQSNQYFVGGVPPVKNDNSMIFAVGLITIAISALFIGMIWDVLIALSRAAIFSAMVSPLYEKALSVLGDRKGIAASGNGT